MIPAVDRTDAPELRNATAQLQEIVDQTSAAVFIKDLAGRLLFVNPACARLAGVSLDSIVGHPDSDVFPESATELRNNDRRVIDERRAIDFEETIVTPDGPRTYLSHKFPLFDDDGHAYAICGIATDITDRKRVEEAVRAAALAVSTAEREDVFKELVRYLAAILRVDVAMIAVYADGDPARMRTLAACLDGKALANFEYALAGSPCRHVVGRAFRFVPEGVQPEFPPRTLFSVKGMDSYAALPLNDSTGRPLGLIATMDRRPMRDAALAEAMLKIFAMRATAEIERTASETQLRQAQKMEAIGHLTGGIAHDFNNLLTSIIGYVTLAAERSANGDPKLATYLEQAGLSCARARDLIQQMLTFSRGGRGEPRVLAPAPVIRDSIKLLRASFASTVEFDIELDDDAPPVLIDPVQLEQVLMNLAINARDALGTSGGIRVTLRRIDASAVCTSCRGSISGDMVELAVSDTGSGIEPDVLERMFEPFFTTKGVGQGTGMGLSTVHGIVHRHGGHIVVVTAPRKGASFRVLLPSLAGERHSSAAHAAGVDHGIPRGALAGHVAVVDDEASVAAFMQELLGQWGLTVTSFADARSALAAVAAGVRFDLIISDQTMPRKSGLELACDVHALRPQLPIILFTGYEEGLAPADVERAGIGVLLRKPIDAPVLLAALRRHLPHVPQVP
jgi:PAS domain S-box-containing protein